jgi:UDP-N-acetylglucosamine kinase
MTPEEERQEAAAFEYAKSNKNIIARKLTNIEIYLPEKEPVSLFMAGSPGAGKTEASKELIETLTDGKNDIIRVDPDELRHEFAEYKGANSYVFQKGVSILVEKIHDLALKQKQSFLLDGTLSRYEKAKQNIERSLKKKRTVQILYVYQKPELAWKFVCAREIAEGRNIRLEDFITQFFGARQVVNRLKSDFKREIMVDLLLKNNDNSNRLYKANIEKIENHIPEKYTPEDIANLLNK